MDERLNRQAWIDAGLGKLAEDGPQSLKVMGIAQHLGVTKGSFYWHFADLQAYKTEVRARVGEQVHARRDAAGERRR
ncbi:TetR family transcriptional regulator [Rugamonas sp. DEMB1]|uniref:TetR family transcriptional regulator n=1 Tax=Rugamonas sp. DEMB1 TaxID=3039386 RepID=UPI00391A7D56